MGRGLWCLPGSGMPSCAPFCVNGVAWTWGKSKGQGDMEQCALVCSLSARTGWRRQGERVRLGATGRGRVAACHCPLPVWTGKGSPGGDRERVAGAWGQGEAAPACLRAPLVHANGVAQIEGEGRGQGEWREGGTCLHTHSAQMRQRGCEGGEWKGGQHALVHPHFLCMKWQWQRKGEGMACSWGGSQCREGERRGVHEESGGAQGYATPPLPLLHIHLVCAETPPLAAPRHMHRRSACEGMLPPLITLPILFPLGRTLSPCLRHPIRAEREHTRAHCSMSPWPLLFPHVHTTPFTQKGVHEGMPLPGRHHSPLPMQPVCAERGTQGQTIPTSPRVTQEGPWSPCVHIDCACFVHHSTT
ncbi:hypothetical protein EDB86DRAFT_2834516 [Lactarius hatsudake]|nr:hypothetical protein EDB86DRAFT_2834516 [Lactarius hatsudake]